MSARVLVCGGRDYGDAHHVASVLGELAKEVGGIDVIIEGGAKGADELAEQWAIHNRIRVARYPADWARYGPSAGAIRNRQMLDKGQPDIVVAFPGGRGTANMIHQAEQAGVPVRRA